MLFGYSILSWLIALVLALLALLLVLFGLPWLLALMGVAIPHIFVWLLAILAFLLVLGGGVGYVPTRRV